MSDLEQDLDTEEGGSVAAGDDRPVFEQNEDGSYLCPECGKPHRTTLSLSAHRAKAHGVAGRKKTGGTGPHGRRRGRPPGSGTKISRQATRRKNIRDTLGEFLSFTDELQGLSNEPLLRLSDVIRRDADRIADSISWIAERLSPLGTLIDLTMGHGGVITVARGFTGVGTWLVGSGRRRREARLAAMEAEALEREGFAAPTVPDEPRYG